MCIVFLYHLKKELKKGGRAIALKGFVSNEKGEKLKKTPEIVLKVPNLKTEDFTAGQIKDYLNRQREEGGREWQLTRKRLYGCKYANPIFDLFVEQIYYLDELMSVPISVRWFN